MDKIRHFTKKTITREPLIIEKWLTPQIKALMKPHSENAEWLTHIADFLLTSALFGHDIMTWSKYKVITSI